MIADPLDQALIRGELDDLEVIFFDLIDSTNSYLLAQPHSVSDTLVLAEGQSAGKGRRSKVWLSPAGRSLSITLGVSTNRDLSELGGLSTIVGIAICQFLHQAGVKDAILKWPNDVLVAGRKLCGILVELKKSKRGIEIIIGVGINVDLTDDEIAQIEQPVTDLRRCGVNLSRTSITVATVTAIRQMVSEFESLGFVPFVERFDELHVLHGQPCSVLIGARTVNGVVRGIAVDGALVVATPNGEETFHGGEVSLRSQVGNGPARH